MPTWPSPMLAAGFTYASDTEPANPKEGETWYDTGSNEAKVYDGAGWSKLTVTDHAELGSVSAGQHRSDSNIRSTVDGSNITVANATDADTVDGKHASDLGGGFNQGFYHRVADGNTSDQAWQTIWSAGSGETAYVSYLNTGQNGTGDWSKYRLNFTNGDTITFNGQTLTPHRRSAGVSSIDYYERYSAGPNEIQAVVLRT